MANIPESSVFEIIGRKEIELVFLRQQAARLQEALMAAKEKECDKECGCGHTPDEGSP